MQMSEICNLLKLQAIAGTQGLDITVLPKDWKKNLIFRNNKKNKNKNFQQIFHEKVSEFSRDFPPFCVFRPTAQKPNASFVKLFEKYAKIMHFRNFIKKRFEIIRKFTNQFQEIEFASKQAND